jgi:hypothetical protein
MPVLRIHALRPEGLDTPALLQSCSEAAAAAFDCLVEHCWSLFVELHDGNCLEGGTIGSANTGTHSPIAVLSACHGQRGGSVVAEGPSAASRDPSQAPLATTPAMSSWSSVN